LVLPLHWQTRRHRLGDLVLESEWQVFLDPVLETELLIQKLGMFVLQSLLLGKDLPENLVPVDDGQLEPFQLSGLEVEVHLALLDLNNFFLLHESLLVQLRQLGAMVLELLQTDGQLGLVRLEVLFVLVFVVIQKGQVLLVKFEATLFPLLQLLG
jgi:hypothetical protein